MFILLFLNHILIQTDPSTAVAEAVQAINNAPQFFDDALQWSINASYKYIGFVAGLALVTHFFKR